MYMKMYMKKQDGIICALMAAFFLHGCVNHDISPKTACGQTEISFDLTIFPLIQQNCAINDCHGGNQFPDFREFSVVQENAQRIKQQVVNRTMPPDQSLTQAQIDSIVCWVDNGTPQNWKLWCGYTQMTLTFKILPFFEVLIAWLKEPPHILERLTFVILIMHCPIKLLLILEEYPHRAKLAPNPQPDEEFCCKKGYSCFAQIQEAPMEPPFSL